MKTIILLFLCGITYAQQSTEKWNSYEKRYEYYDSNGDMTGYKTYNQYERQWEYFEVPKKKEYPVTSNVNIPLTERALSSRQNSYDRNRARLQGVVDNIYKVLGEIVDPAERKLKTDKFTREYFNPINNKPADLSSKTITDRIINHLIQGFENVIGF